MKPSSLARRVGPLLLALAALGTTAPRLVQGQATILETYTYTPNLAVPDNSPVGVTDSHVIGSAILDIRQVSVTLNLTGGFNGDFYVYLVHATPLGTGFSVLLNRAGTTASNSFGYADSGFSVTFSDLALTDAHLYRNQTNPMGGTLTGTFQPDARNVSPFSVTDASPRSAFLSSFNNLDANGTWSLYLADLSPVGTGTLASWTLTIQGVPEPGTWAAGIGALAVAAGAWRRRKKGQA